MPEGTDNSTPVNEPRAASRAQNHVTSHPSPLIVRLGLTFSEPNEAELFPSESNVTPRNATMLTIRLPLFELDRATFAPSPSW